MSEIAEKQPINWAHDLRSPLTGILGFARLITESNDIETIHSWAEKIVRSGDNMERLIDEMAAAGSTPSAETQL